MNSKADIIKELEQSFGAMAEYIASLSQTQFEYHAEGKWSAGQHLDHLIKSIKPINKFLYLPQWYFTLRMGKMNRPPRTYEALSQRYYEKLKMGGKAPAPFIPPEIPYSMATEKIKEYRIQLKRLIRHLKRKSEKDLDSLLLPHPLLGKLCLREMMYFTVLHTRHHLQHAQTGTEAEKGN